MTSSIPAAKLLCHRTGMTLAMSAGMALALSACTTVTVDLPATVATPAQFQSVNGETPTAQAHTIDLSRWWKDIPDPTLNALIDKGLSSNTDIRIATARVKEARAVITQAESALYPTLQALGGVGRSKPEELRGPGLPATTVAPGVTLPAVPSTIGNAPINSFSGYGVAAAWEVDVFGARRSDADAARQAALAYEEKLHGAQLMVAGDIASNYIEARSLERRIKLVDMSVAAALKLQRYAEGRFEAGQATRFDVDRARAQVQALSANKAPLESLLSARLRRLAVLTAQTPESLGALPTPTAQAPADASVIPTQLPSVLPSDVLERRPDVRGSANQVRALAAKLGSAKADLLPRFYLGFLANDGRIEIGDLATTSGKFTSWGAGVQIPIFEGGRIRANIKASDARLEAATVQYEQAVLTALEDVENAYSARRALDQRATQLTAAWHTAADGAQHAEQLFEQGNGLLQPVLEARLGALQREDDLIQAQTARALTTVLLFKSIGGGWTPESARP
jgi:NodT family efflux transporter outer membrane factor (OMF) lipoprotein